MPLTREEILQIAKAVAEKVLRITPCACGYATWNANQHLEWARSAINSKDEKMLQAHLSSFRGILDDVEAFCGLNMEATRSGVSLIEREVDAKAWGAAWGQNQIVSNDLHYRLREAKEKELAESSSKASPGGTNMKKPTRYDVRVDSWQERDRLGIWVTDTRTDKTIAEWWDDNARQMFEDGFFKPGVPQYSWEKPSPAFVDSVLDYLEHTGVLAKESQSSSPSPEASVSGEGRKYLTGQKAE